jgi:hypothetical protein
MLSYQHVGDVMLKTIHFRNVEWFGNQENLLNLVTQALVGRPNVNDTEFPSEGQVCEVRHRHMAQNEARLHVSMHVPGAEKAVSPRAVGQAAADLASTAPPQNSEFTEREIAVVIRPDRIGYVVAGRARSSTVRNVLSGLITLGHGAGIGNRLNLSARADQAAIQQLLADGVKSFDLGLTLPTVNAMNVVDGQPLPLGRTIGRAIAQSISARFLEDHEDGHIDELANMNASITINARRGAPEAEIEALTKLATEAVESDDEFTLKTRNGAKISREKLILTATYNQPGDAPVLSYLVAWNEISNFLDAV